MIVDPTRQHIIRKMQSRIITKEEFNFDHLSTYPLYSLLTQYDVDRLYNIASSIRYSGNINKKYKAMDEILRPRGFVKLVAGTNRVAYRHLEVDNIVIKTAVDFVGIQDTPHEFENQKIFKPFITKVFEASEDGTVGLFERVKGIVSREEFLSIASDVFAVISEWFVGEYVLADIGTKYFMNWGYRDNFGPVLLDFPYCYKLDGNKLFCCAPDENSQTGLCGGLIDYDDGYNYLHCKKCGVVYKAQELAEKIKTNRIQKIGGKRTMRVGFKRGDKVYYSDNRDNNTVVLNETSSIPVRENVNNSNNKPKNKVRKFTKEDILSMKFERTGISSETLINRKTGVVIKLPDDITEAIAMNEYYKETTDECNKTIESLKRMKKEIEEKYNALKEENEALNKQVNDLKTEIENLQEEKTKIGDDYDRLSKVYKQLEFFLSEETKRKEILESDIKHLESDNNEIQSLYEKECERCKKLVEMNESLKSSVERTSFSEDELKSLYDRTLVTVGGKIPRIDILEDIANINKITKDKYNGIVLVEGEVTSLLKVSENLSKPDFTFDDKCILLYNKAGEYLVDNNNNILALTSVNGCNIDNLGILYEDIEEDENKHGIE